MLTQHVDSVQGQHGTIEGIAPIPRFPGGMCRLTVKGNAIVIEGQKVRVGIGLGRRYMNHHRQVIIVKHALLTHDDLTTAQFFIGCTDEVDVNGKVLQVL